MTTPVEDYIKKLKSPQREICSEVRRIILETVPGVHEQMKMDAAWYEDKVYLAALGEHVTVGFSLAGLSKEERTALHSGEQSMKHLTLKSVQEIDERWLKEILRRVLL
ncbi:MAG: DUF1801 domain-containing protein [Bacteroidota bacterium]